MFCPKCGAQLPDGSSFCSSCGAMLDSQPEVTAQEEPAAASPAPQYAAQENPAPAQYEAQGEPAPQYAAQEDPAPAQYEAQENTVPQYGAQPAPAAAGNGGAAAIMSGIKKIPVKFIAIGAGALAAIIIIIIVIASLAGGGKPANAYAYISDGTFSLITNIRSDEHPEIDSVRYASGYSSLGGFLEFSEDGRYLYYFSKMDDYSGTGTLCRVEYTKLGLNSSDNEKYIEVIDKNVKRGFTQVSGGLVYVNDNGNLYYYNGTESQKLASSVGQYLTDDKGRVVYTTDSALYGVDLKDIDNKEKLISSPNYLVDMSDFDNIIYGKSNDDGTYDMYTAGFGKDSEKVADDVSEFVYSGNGVVYYLVKGEKPLLAYDYIVDDYASQDAGVTRPNEEDYRIPNYRYSDLYTYSSTDNYDGIYLSLTNYTNFISDQLSTYSNLYWDYYWYYLYGYDAGDLQITNIDKWEAIYDYYYSSFGYDYSLEYAAEHDPLFASEYKAFVDKYKGQADENGYILVTDTIKQDLQQLYITCTNYTMLFDITGGISPSEPEDTAWQSFCYGRYESGYTTDDKYYEDLNKYYEVADRIEIRDTLKKDDYYSRYAYTLYRYENGASETVSENLLNYNRTGGAITFNTSDSITKKIRIEDLYWAYDAMSAFDYSYEDSNFYLLPDSGTVLKFSDAAFEDYLEICYENDGQLRFTEKHVYICSYEDGLYAANINGDTVEAFERVDDEASISTVDYEADTVYYFTDIDGDYGTLCSATGTESRTLVKDMLFGSDCFDIYEDGVIIAYTDESYHSYTYVHEISMIDAGGSQTTIDDDVTSFIRVDSSNLLYISDGDLYHFDGSNKTRLAYDVDWVWSLNVMEPIF